MPNLLDWKEQSFQQRVNLVIDMFTLEQDQIDTIIEIWSKREYEDGWTGHETAIADLMELLKWESLPPNMREEEKQRMARR